MDESRIEEAARRALEIAGKAKEKGLRGSMKALLRSEMDEDGNLRELDRGDVDFRVVTVTVENGPVAKGLWCSHSLASARGVRGSDLSPRVRTLVESLAGMRANLVHKIEANGSRLDPDAAQMRAADAETWAKLLMLCAAGLDGYEMRCF